MIKIKLFFLVILMTCFNSLNIGQCARLFVVDANLEAGDSKGAGKIIPIQKMMILKTKEFLVSLSI